MPKMLLHYLLRTTRSSWTVNVGCAAQCDDKAEGAPAKGFRFIGACVCECGSHFEPGIYYSQRF